MHARQLTTLYDAAFTAYHVKSNEKRGYNRKRQDACVAIYRVKLSPAFTRVIRLPTRSTGKCWLLDKEGSSGKPVWQRASALLSDK